MRELLSTEEKILDRALYLIGQNRDLNVSIRSIAKEAGVNVSAINYYFRTKEEMIRQIKLFYLDNMNSILSIFNSTEYSDEEKLILGANEIMEYNLRFPGVTVILRESIKNKDHDEIFFKIVDATNEMNQHIERIIGVLTQKSNLNIKQKLTVFMSSIVYPIENSDFMSYSNDHLKTMEDRHIYIKNILEILKK